MDWSRTVTVTILGTRWIKKSLLWDPFLTFFKKGIIWFSLVLIRSVFKNMNHYKVCKLLWKKSITRCVVIRWSNSEMQSRQQKILLPLLGSMIREVSLKM